VQSVYIICFFFKADLLFMGILSFPWQQTPSIFIPQLTCFVRITHQTHFFRTADQTGHSFLSNMTLDAPKL